MVKALLIEDDRKLAALLVEFLGQHGVEAIIAGDSGQALQHLGASRFDILLLDLMLPGMDGLTLARKVRERSNTPIIMVTARGDDADKIVGLELGADDYLAKPFNPRELLARIRAVLRRAEPGDAPRFQSGGLLIDFSAREVTVDGKRQLLTAHEYELLCALARNSGRVLTRDQLLEEMKGDHADDAFDRAWCSPPSGFSPGGPFWRCIAVALGSPLIWDGCFRRPAIRSACSGQSRSSTKSSEWMRPSSVLVAR
ncbi:MAG: response regulator transcription factor [Deltaproteobacteria bacterium]|nr:MAG: response regulator transcription factor [Deltaproteobacteria bacterium]